MSIESVSIATSLFRRQWDKAAIALMGGSPWVLLILFLASAGLSGCMSDASLVRETPTGGVVGFSYTKESETLSSLGRSEALALMEKKCPQGYRIVHEGTIPRVSREADRKWRGQISTVYDGGVEERLWGLQFTCK